MKEMFIYLPTLRVEVEKDGMPIRSFFIYRMIYRKFS